MKLSVASALCALAATVWAAAAVPVVPQHRLHHRHKEAPRRNEHQVGDLPGLRREDVPFDHFAGQIHLSADSDEKLFYWLAESKGNASADPVVLWLNGGPGCASTNGFLTENGPFVPQPDATVKLNPYGWNRKANVVWVDSPAGVGFSGDVQPGGGDYYNDDVVADRLRTFLSAFFDEYPAFQGREFYIAGESYAGMYIPFLVDLLLAKPLPGVNLQGFAIGNPLTDTAIESNAYLDYYESHALISRQTHRAVRDDACGGDLSHCFFWSDECLEQCQAGVTTALASANADAFNHYYIYGDVCLLENTQRNALLVHHLDRVDKVHGAVEGTEALGTTATGTRHREVVSPCAGRFTDTFFNLVEVQEALHVEGAPVEWVDCQSKISRNFRHSKTSLHKYRNILGRGLKVLIYSGDADSVVNFMGTERWIGEEGLNLTEVAPWQAWFGPDQQIAGYVQQFDGLAFRTVKGAGHMVPAVRPLHALHLFECFLYGEDECSGFDYPSDVSELVAGGVIANAKSPSFVISSDNSSPSSSWVFVGCAAVALAVGAVTTQYIKRQRLHRRAEYQPISGGASILSS